MPRSKMSVPGIPADGGRILTKPLRPVTKTQLAGPMVIDTSGRPPGASRRFRDYIPSAERKKEIMLAKGVHIDEEKREEKVHTRQVVRHVGQDYLSGEESKEARKKQNSLILETAKDLWGQEKDERKRYKQAQKIVNEASDEEIENPSPRLRRALSILDGGKPITKAEAMQKAREKLFRV